MWEFLLALAEIFLFIVVVGAGIGACMAIVMWVQDYFDER